MRILVLQNLYPPLGHGGYAVACAAAVRGLIARGHEVTVLTTNFGLRSERLPDEANVIRELEPNPWLMFDPPQKNLIRREWHNQRALQRTLTRVQPDLVYVWAMDGISTSLVSTCLGRSMPVVFSIHSWWLRDAEHDPWVRFWSHVPKSRWRRCIKRMLTIAGARSLANRLIAPVDIDNWSLCYCTFPSQHRKQEYLEAGLAVSDGAVIYNGIDAQTFYPSDKEEDQGSAMRLLYAGLLVQPKGIEVVLQACGQLDSATRQKIVLTVVGSAPDVNYESQLHRLVEELHLQGHVRFAGQASHEAMPDIYRQHDVLLFPSIVPEGLPLTLLEGMASGLTVISTSTGGSTEIVVHESNALVVPPGNPQALAEAIRRITYDTDLRQRLRCAALATVQERFVDLVVQDQIQTYLKNVLEQNHRVATQKRAHP